MRSPLIAAGLIALGSAMAQNGTLTFSPSPLVFCAEPGQGISEVPISISTSSGSVLFTSADVTSDGNWLSITPTTGLITTTSHVMFFAAIKGGIVTLPTGAYNAKIVLIGNGAVVATVNASLIVSSTACGSTGVGVISASPGALTFQLPAGVTTAIQSVQVRNTFPTYVAAGLDSITPPGQNWLTVSDSLGLPSHTTSPMFISVSSAGLGAGQIYKGSVEMSTSTGATLSIPVTLNLTAPAGNVTPVANPNPVSINLPLAAPSATQRIQLTNPSSSAINIATGIGGLNGLNWLSVSPQAELIPANSTVTLTATVTNAGLVTGINGGVIGVDVKSGGPGTLNIPVSVNYGTSAGNPTISVVPVQLSFASPTGTTPPPSQNLSLTSNLPANFSIQVTISNGGSWLMVSPLTGVANSGTPTNVKVQVNPSGLTPKSYNGQIVITNTNTGEQTQIPVTLLVSDPAPLLAVSPATLTFHYQAGVATIPQAQPVQVTSTGASVPFTAATAANFLTVTPASGATPATVNVGLNTAALATLSAGQYSGTVTIGTQTVNVELVVTPAPQTTIGAVVNAASLRPSPIAPGELITVFGSGLGPTDGVIFALTGQGTVPTTLANTVVTFDGVPAPLTFVNATQINAIVPYEMAGRVSAMVVVSRPGAVSPALNLKVADTMPAIFSMNQSGNGQGAILNQDNTVNGPSNPAASGSVIQIFATGEGFCPGVSTGSLVPGRPPFPKPAASVSVTIGGKPALLYYSGGAPGSVAGLLQVNAVIPDSLGSGPQAVVLKVGDNANDWQTIVVSVQ